MPTLNLFLLGPFRATLAQQPIASFGADKVRALLAYLALENRRAHPRERLAGLLWSDQPEEKALHSLRQALSMLRKALGENASPPFLLIERESIQFNPACDHRVDAHAFAAHLAEALRYYQRCDDSGCINIHRLQQAVGLYGGDFLDQFYLSGAPLFEEWATIQREAFHHQMVDALARLIEYHERRGEYAPAQRLAQRLVELAPWDEAALRHLMTLYANNGQWSAAQSQFASYRRYLGGQTGIEPAPETFALLEDILRAEAQQKPIAPRLPPARHNLPAAATPFIGRAAEMETLAGHLANPACRLITLTGPGGVGKTRLALEAARQQVGLHNDGVFFVPLAAIPSAALLVPAIADSLGFKFYTPDNPRKQLINFLRDRQLLLALDNFEHLLAAQSPSDTGTDDDPRDLLIEILDQAPGVRLLAASRQALHLRAETVIELEGMEYPASEQPGERVYDALALFEASVQRIRPRYSLQAEYAAAARICRLLDGLPLAIELSAAWARVYDGQEIAARIEQAAASVGEMDFLSTAMRDVPARHRSLRAVFEHSWQLLSADEQRLFSALAVFRGGFSVESAAAVAQGLFSPETCAARIEALSGKSLLRRSGNGRFDLHSLLLQFAAEKLAEHPEERGRLERLHAEHFAAFLAGRQTSLQGKDPKPALAEIIAEMDNVRRGWQRAVETNQFHTLQRFLPALSQFYEMRSRFHEGRDALRAALEALSAEPQANPLRGMIAVRRGLFEIHLGEYAQAKASCEQALGWLEAAGPPTEQALAHHGLCNAAYQLSDFPAAKAHAETGLALLGAGGADAVEALLRNDFGDVVWVLGDFDAAQAAYEGVLALYQRGENAWGLARAHNSLGILAGSRGEYGRAGEHFAQSLALFREIGDRSGTARALHNLSILAYLRKEYTQTRQLRLECLEIVREIGYQWGVTSTLKHLGDVEKALGNAAAARQYYEQSLTNAQRLQDAKSAVYALDSLGSLAHLQKEPAQALGYYRQALTTALEIGLKPVAIDTLCGIAEVLGEMGELAQAVELAAFVAAHSGVDEQTRERGRSVLADLELRGGNGAGAEARTRGERLSLEEIAARLA